MVVNSIGSTAGVATPLPSLRKTSKAAWCGFSPKTPRADFTQLLLDPTSERPVAAARAFKRVAWQVLDPDYRDDFD